MADTLAVGATKNLLVDGRNPFADEAVSEDGAGAVISIGAAAADGTVSVTGVAEGTATITVQPGAETEDAQKSAGTDTVTVFTATPLAVTLG